jgi:hypothetical protein
MTYTVSVRRKTQSNKQTKKFLAKHVDNTSIQIRSVDQTRVSIHEVEKLEVTEQFFKRETHQINLKNVCIVVKIHP